MKCTICEREIEHLYDPHLKFPDIMVDINDDGEKQPLCRHCAVGTLLLSEGDFSKLLSGRR